MKEEIVLELPHEGTQLNPKKWSKGLNAMDESVESILEKRVNTRLSCAQMHTGKT